MRIFSFLPFRWVERRSRSTDRRRPRRRRSRGLQGPGVRPLLLAAAAVALVVPSALQGQWPGEVLGQVLDERTGIGIAGVRVTVAGSSLSVLSEGDGGFLLRPVDEGEALVRVQRYGYAPTEVSLEVRPGVTTQLTIRLRPAAVELDPVGVRAERTAVGATHLSRAEIAASGAGTLGELLDGVAGVSLVRRGVGGEETVTFRGAPASHTLVLVDGVPLNDPVTGVADLSTLSARVVSSVEVLPGARGARFGPGAMGGVILVGTRSDGPSVAGSVGGGSLGQLRASADGHSTLLDRWRVSAGARASTLEGTFGFDQDPRVGGGQGERVNADSEEFGARVGLGSRNDRPGEGWEVTLRGSRLERGVPGKSFAPSRQARQQLDQSAGRFRVERLLSTGEQPIELRVRAGLDRRRLHFRDPAPPLGPPFDDRSSALTLDLGAEIDGVSWVDGWLAAGAGFDARTLSLRSDALDPAFASVRRVDAGAFGHAETEGLPLPLAPVLHGALRIDRSPEGPVVSHEVSVRAAIPAGGHLHVAHRSAFSPPSLGDQFFREGVGVTPNPDLRAERVPGEFELAASLPFAAGSFTGRVSGLLFRGDIRDHIVWAPDFRFVWSPRNVDVRRRGWTLRSELRHPNGLAASGNVTRAEARYLHAGAEPSSQLAYRPRWTGGLSASWSHERWRLSTGTRYVGPRFPVPAPVNELPGFWSTDLGVSGRARVSGWELEPSVRVDRLFDERSPFIFSIPEPGRTFRFDLEIRRAP